MEHNPCYLTYVAVFATRTILNYTRVKLIIQLAFAKPRISGAKLEVPKVDGEVDGEGIRLTQLMSCQTMVRAGTCKMSQRAQNQNGHFAPFKLLNNKIFIFKNQIQLL